MVQGELAGGHLDPHHAFASVTALPVPVLQARPVQGEVLQGIGEADGLGQVSDGALTSIRRKPVLNNATIAQLRQRIGRCDSDFARVAAPSSACVYHFDTGHAERPQCGQKQGEIGRLELVFRFRGWHG